MSDWRYFPKSSPREAKGGIRAQSSRGGFAEKWWAKRWISVLESFDLGPRLQRGRSYARRGQVLAIVVQAGTVTASVLGSRPRPYDVHIKVKLLAEPQWRKLAEVVASQAIFGAKLLAGEMPQDIETVFAAAGLSLFPEKRSDLKTECSCPDWSNPCKHIAAVYYLLGEEFDRDPFLIFQLRGIPRERFVELLGAVAPVPPVTGPEPPEPEPLPVSPVGFWSGKALPDDLVGPPAPDAAGAVLPKRLGKFPFWRGRDNYLETMDSIYRAAARAAVRLLSLEDRMAESASDLESTH